MRRLHPPCSATSTSTSTCSAVLLKLRRCAAPFDVG